MTAYAPKAQVARAYLSRPYNDIDVYVEDVRCHNMYVRLLNRMLDGAARVTSVFPMGGRKALLEQCAADQDEAGRKRLYLMDADFDLLLGRPAPELKHLQRLSVYCIENVLLSENALVQLALEASPDRPEHELRSDLRFNHNSTIAARVLLPLFVLYAIAAELGVTVDTSSFSAVRLCQKPSDPRTLSAALVRSRMRSVRLEILKTKTMEEYQAAKAKVRGNLASWRGPREHLISGKTQWLPLAHGLLRSVAGLRDSPDSFKVRLAAYCDLEIDPSTAARLRSLVS